MARDDDQLLREKRLFDILCVATVRFKALKYEKKGETPGEVAIVEDKEKKRTRRVTNSGLSKRQKIDECGSQNPQQNPSSDASSLRLCPVESKNVRQAPVYNKAVRRRKAPVRRRKGQVRIRKPGPERGVTPEWLVNVMREVNGTDVKLIKKKGLTTSDLTGGQARLLIPWNGITDMDFLNEDELKIIDEHHNKLRDTGVDFTLVDSRCQQWDLNIRRWDMNTSPNYTLCKGWNKVVAANGFVVKQTLWIWSFRSQDRLYIAFVPPDPALALAPVPDPAPAVTRDSGQSSSAM